MSSSSFLEMAKKIQEDIKRAAEVCGDIKANRHCGSHHKNLDELEEALKAGPMFVQNLLEGLSSVGPNNAHNPATDTLAALVRDVQEIGSKLEDIAYPEHPPGHHHHHHHHHQRSLFFPIYVRPQHKVKVDPHFHDMTFKLEEVRHGITQAFDEMKVQLADTPCTENATKIEGDKAVDAVEDTKVDSESVTLQDTEIN